MRFTHTKEDKILINEYKFPLKWWLTQEPDYKLPEGYVARIYIPGKQNHLTLMKGDTPCQYDGGYDDKDKFLWDEGDGYIKKLQTYIDAYDLFINPPAPPLTKLELDEVFNSGIKKELRILDFKSIRDIREWVVSQPNAPTNLIQLEANIVAKRSKFKVE